MTATLDPPVTDAGSPSFEDLCRTLEELDVPDGFRAEIIGGEDRRVVVVQGVVQRHSRRAHRPTRPPGHRVRAYPNLYLFPGQSRAYGPDLHIADAVATHVNSIYLPGEALSLVAELTSNATAEIDRADKVEVYGKAGVPVYVLVDMLEHTVTVYSSPSDHGYRTHTQMSSATRSASPRLSTATWTPAAGSSNQA